MSAAVLVTGGAGYVGSHTCKALAAAGYRPVVFDNLSTGYEWAVQWGPLVKGDLHDQLALVAAMKEHKALAVLHFAACAYVGESATDPLKYYRNNIAGTISLIGAMETCGIDKFIFSSTCASYGVPETDFLTEDAPQRPINPYGRTKLAVENLLSDLAAAGKLNYVALRYFNAAGADPDGRIGEAHDPETHLIPLAIDAGMGGAPLNILGEDFPTPDGTPIRDYTHVCDLADAHVRSLEYLLKGGKSDFFNLGSGKGHSVLEVVAALKALGLDVKTRKAPRRAGDPPRLVANAGKAAKILGWRTQMSDLPTILTHAVAWHRKKK